jgi:hypothetical protein
MNTSDIALLVSVLVMIAFAVTSFYLLLKVDKLKRALAKEKNSNKIQRALDQGHCNNGLMFK